MLNEAGISSSSSRQTPKGGVARAIRTLRAAANPAPADRVVPLSPKMVGLRFQAAARAAGVEHVTAHSGRVGLASEFTSRGAPTTDVMLAGNWKTNRMVAHYSAGATAERGGRGAVPLSSQGHHAFAQHAGAAAVPEQLIGTGPCRSSRGPPSTASGSIDQSRDLFEALDHLFEHCVVLLVHR